VFEKDCSVKWQANTQDASSGNTGSSVFDFEGDGSAEAVYADETKLWAFNGADGTVKLQSTQHANGTWLEYPAIADVDADDHAEIVVANTGSKLGIYVFGDAGDSWMPGRKIWNQHAYSITNVNDDGTIPAVTVTNWLSYNNFRSGDLAAATGGALSDALPVAGDVCIEECRSGRVYVVVAVGNQGTSELPAGVAISAYAITDADPVYLQTQVVPDAIASGASSLGLEFDFATADLPYGAVEFIADDDNGRASITECNEDNNTLVISDGLCE